ncbi:pyruvate:ferredoxin (flavodoxin) oxidoreductase [Dactylosporangium matsuzakiense]|uniref:pyruvate:ferredoxin (flavodoxin) oxidoreductase n=1 Tax=Dactylosporangium matsuzakiense TaxID=53360 RepID=UPI0022F2BB5F|nr:pyruvate:ferredoxin (flavodoxin) oxidoreductase [Dactylosporangium matsuzakiense]
MSFERACIDGNEAAARVAHALSDVVAIYPITPASPMGEHADAWSAAGRANIWGTVPEVVEMQSEAGAAGALHGAVTKGVLGTTFTSSQGLLLMLPNMYKIAGELTPAVMHVAARTIATHALSIFGDHSDVMSARMTGWALLCASSVQEAHDFALVAHAAALRSRVPFLHFFDGFRTSHELNTVQLLRDDDLRALVRDEDVLAHRRRGLTPDRPVARGTAQNPDVFFQAREASNPYYDAVPAVVTELLDELALRTGRRYGLVDYIGAADAERVVVLMGSGVGATAETVEELNRRGERVGALVVRLYRPFPAAEFVAALPAGVRSIAVLDRCKEPGATGDPLHLDVVSALVDHRPGPLPNVVGGRYGLASKEFTPAMVKGVFDHLRRPNPARRFTVGIVDDVTHLSIPADPDFQMSTRAVSAVFIGLGSDGTVGANKNSIKIIGEGTDGYAQGYFVLDSRKSGSVTVSHLRFGPDEIRSTYLIDQADFVAVHQFTLLSSMRTVDLAKPGGVLLLNAPYPAEEVWEHLPVEVQEQIVDKRLQLYVVDAHRVAREVGLGGRINTVMQPCFFQLSGVLPAAEAIARIKASIEKTYAKRGTAVVERNIAAVDRALVELRPVAVPERVVGELHRMPPPPPDAPDFVRTVTAKMLAGQGDLLPVSALPVDGVWPTGTSRWEKRAIAQELPVWNPDICTDCGKCALVCPHTALRIKVFDPQQLTGAPPEFQSKDYRSRELPGWQLALQVAPDDCTGCGICVDVCPALSKTDPRHKAINMQPAREHRDRQRPNFEFFLQIPEAPRDKVRHDTVKGAVQLQPLFEFSGACSGCGETPYIRALTQLFGDRMVIANATGCSSIFGGNLPTSPYTKNADGRGSAWANSLFEDNAEFGLGMRLAWEQQHATARRYVEQLRDVIGAQLAEALLGADQSTEAGVVEQRARVMALKQVLDRPDGARSASARHLRSLADELVEKTFWIVGGDGWAYDIGYGGLDHVLASGRNVNVLILDSEVYSNTGGQASKATPRGACAKFAASGKSRAKKDLGAIAMTYGGVFVAQIAMGANEQQTIRALVQAQAWPGPSVVIAYATCIAHGIEMSTSMTHQKQAVASGYWPLYRYRPSEEAEGRPFALDSKAPTIPVADFAATETRFTMLARSDPERSEHLLTLAQADTDERWRYYSQLAGVTRTLPHGEDGDGDASDDTAPPAGGGSTS